MPLNILLIAAIMLAVFVAAAGSNQLVRARNQVQEAWSGIDVQLGRRPVSPRISSKPFGVTRTTSGRHSST